MRRWKYIVACVACFALFKACYTIGQERRAQPAPTATAPAAIAPAPAASEQGPWLHYQGR